VCFNPIYSDSVFVENSEIFVAVELDGKCWLRSVLKVLKTRDRDIGTKDKISE
jgi:hypothetical protein